jgi:hypothetical protein
MSTRHQILATWAAILLAASSAVAQTASPTGTPAPPREEPPAAPFAGGAQASAPPRPLPGETTVDAPARSREQATPRLPDVLRTVPGVTPR